jgi:hypothetical protein
VARLTGRGAELPAWEQAVILEIAEEFSIDPAALAAIRIIENGAPGREFGVLSVSAPSYRDQATVAARTLRNTLERYEVNVQRSPHGPDGHYTEDFLRYFSRGGPGYAGYAPYNPDTGQSAENDPRGLNAHHFPNLVTVYGASGVAV